MMRGLLAGFVMWTTACASTQSAPAGNPARMPEFPFQFLAGPHNQGGMVFLNQDGSVRKFRVQVTAEAVPAWLSSLAQEKLGSGADQSYYVEEYADGDQVYEVERQTEAGWAKLSARPDQTVRYIEKALQDEAVPPAMKAAVDGVANFSPRRFTIRQSKTAREYRVRGEQAGKLRTLVLDQDQAGQVTVSNLYNVRTSE